MTAMDTEPTCYLMEELEAEHVFILMKRDYRVSRNVRARWFFEHINKFVSIGENVNEDLEVVGILERDLRASKQSQKLDLHDSCSNLPKEFENAPAEKACDVQRRYRITPTTVVTFLAKRHRLVFVLDLTPSIAIVDIRQNQVLFEKVFEALHNCLKGLTKPFVVPGSEVSYSPQLYITVIAHTPFVVLSSEQVLLQGVLVNECNVEGLLNEMREKLRSVETYEAQTIGKMVKQLQDNNKARKESISGEHTTSVTIPSSSVLSRQQPFRSDTLCVPPEISMVNMLRKAILAIQLLPENTSAGIAIITDGVTGLADLSILQSILVQLRNSSILCSFIQVRSAYHPECSFGHIPFSEFMQFMATSTFGAYLPVFPNLDEGGFELNVYHKAMLCWTFQRALYGYKFDPKMHKHWEESSWHIRNPSFSTNTESSLLRKRLLATSINTSFWNIMSVRLREGYTIKQVVACKNDNEVDVVLMLPWKDSVNIEYHIVSEWPYVEEPDSLPRVKVEIAVKASYEFLADLMQTSPNFRSPYRQAVVTLFRDMIEGITKADKLLVHLHSFNTNPAFYVIPEGVKNGVPVFYLPPNQDTFVLCSREQLQNYAQFCSFWKPVCNLDINIWQKWLHTHRLGLVMEHDSPLPKYLHLPAPASSRYAQIQCRQATTALHQFLTEEASFTLLDDHSYVKFMPEGLGAGEKPKYFFVIRTIFKPPCVTLRIAFLGGTEGHERNEIVNGLRKRLLSIKINQRKETSLLGRAGVSPRRTALSSNVEMPAFTLLQKPVEKFFIRYEKLPFDFSCISDTTTYKTSSGQSGQAVSAVRASTSLYNTLSKYLHPRRYIWSLRRQPSGFPVSSQTAAHILQVLTRRRLNEGFHFALTGGGMINFVQEMTMKPLTCSEKSHKCDGVTYRCVVQYILHPPIPVNSQSQIDTGGSEEDSSEFESAESDFEVQLVTEVWTEPQSGRVTRHKHPFYNGADFQNIPVRMFDIDLEVIFTLTTFAHLHLLWQDISTHRTTSSFSPHPKRIASSDQIQRKCNETAGGETSDSPVVFIPSCFELTHLLNHSQMATMLFSTLKYSSESSDSSDIVNKLFVKLFNSEMLQHHPREVDIEDSLPSIWTHILKRIYPHARGNTSMRKIVMCLNSHLKESHSNQAQSAGQQQTAAPASQLSFLPRLRCYLNFLSEDRLVLVFLPASFEDFLTLLSLPPNRLQHLSSSRRIADVPYHLEDWDECSDSSSSECENVITNARGGARKKSGTSSSANVNLNLRRSTLGGSRVSYGSSSTAVPSVIHSVSSRLRRLTGQRGEEEDGVSLPFPVFLFTAYLPKIAFRLSSGERPSHLTDHFMDLLTEFEDRSVLSDLHRMVSRVSGSECREKELEKHPLFDQPLESVDDFSCSSYSTWIEHMYSKAFVNTVYQSLLLEYPISRLDAVTAIDGKCEEFLVEVDMTEFIFLVCKHASTEFNDQNNPLKRCNTFDSEFSFSSKATESTGFLSQQPDQDGENCSTALHLKMKEEFRALLLKRLRAVPSAPQYLFLYKDAENSEQNSVSSSVVSLDGNENADETVAFVSEGAPEAIEAKRSRRPGISTTLLSPTQSLHEYLDKISSSLESIVSAHSGRDDKRIYPLFFQLTCSVRNTRSNEVASCLLEQFPTCIIELLEGTNFAEDSDLDCHAFQVTLDIVALTYGSDAAAMPTSALQQQASDSVSDFDNIDLPDRFGNETPWSDQIQLRRQSTYIGSCDDFENTNRFLTDGIVGLRSQLVQLDESQRNVLELLVLEVRFFLNNEVAFALRQSSSVDESVLRSVIRQIETSAEKALVPGAQSTMVPLTFVGKERESMAKYTKELGNLHIGMWKLVQCGKYFYVDYCEECLLKERQEQAKQSQVKTPLSAEQKFLNSAKLLEYEFGAISSSLPKFYISENHLNNEEQAQSSDSYTQTTSTADANTLQENQARSKALQVRCRSFAGFVEFIGAEVANVGVREQSILQRCGSAIEVHHKTEDSSALPGNSTLYLQNNNQQKQMLPSKPIKKSYSFANAGVVRHCSGGHHKQANSETAPALLNAFGSVGDRLYNCRSNVSTSNVSSFSLQEIVDENVTYGINDDVQGNDENEAPGVPSCLTAYGGLLNEDNPKPDFWLIVKLEHCQASVTFLQRPEHHYATVFAEFIHHLQNLSVKVNRFMLLEALHENRICNELMLPVDHEDANFHDREKNASISSDDLNDQGEGSDNGYFAAASRFKPGTFFCECVWYTSFAVHPRLKATHGAAGIARGVQALKVLLNKFAVQNRENLFVFRETTGNIFYIRLHDSMKSLRLALKYSTTIQSSDVLCAIVEEEESKSRALSPALPASSGSHNLSTSLLTPSSPLYPLDHIFLTVHGIVEPGPEVKVDLVKALQHRLDDAVLASLCEALRRNPNCKLTSADVKFVQPPDVQPHSVLHYCIPTAAAVHLFSWQYYIKQHFSFFTIRPHYVGEGDKFRSYVGNETDAAVFLYSRPHEIGGKGPGVCCISMCLVDGKGNPVPVIAVDPIEMDGFVKFFAPGLKFASLTKVRKYDSKTALAKKGPGPTALIQVALWERGSVHLESLQEKIEGAVFQACCDIITEFGLLTAPTVDSFQHIASGLPVSEPGSPTSKTQDFQSIQSIRKRHSSAAMGPCVYNSAGGGHSRSRFSFETMQSRKSSGPESAISAKTSLNSRPSVVAPLQLPPMRLHPLFAMCTDWLDYVLSKGPGCDSALKHWQFELPSDYSRCQVVAELQSFLYRPLLGSSNVMCFKRCTANEIQGSLPVYEEYKFNEAFDLHASNTLSCDIYQRSVSVDTFKSTDNDFILISQSLDLWSDSIRYSQDPQIELSKSIAELIDAKSRPLQLFLPLVQKITSGIAVSAFVPRQRFLYIRVIDRNVSVYVYNWSRELCVTLDGFLSRTILWQHARSQLLRQICLQKMGLFSVKVDDNEVRKNAYLSVCWSYPECFVRSWRLPNTSLPRAPNFLKLHPDYARLQTPWFDGSGSIWQWSFDCSGIACSPVDPLLSQGSDLNELRHRLRQNIDRKIRLEAIWQSWLKAEEIIASRGGSITEYVLAKDDITSFLAEQSRLVHYVYSPLLFSPSWREKIALVRCPSDSRKPQPTPTLRSRNSSGQSQHYGTSSQLSPNPQQHKERANSSSTLASSKDGWHYALQNLFCTQYFQYLNHLGLRVVILEASDGTRKDSLNSDPLSPAESPEVWLQRTLPLGMILVHLSFAEPYFVIKIYACDKALITGDPDSVSSEEMKFFSAEVERIVTLSHVHSFSYDFHLRIVQFYLSGRQLIFKPGYYLNAFLNDFLSYYNCQPVFARTFIHEDICHVSGLTSTPDILYNHLLAHDRMYGLKVIKMRIPSASSGNERQSEYLLASFSNYVHKFTDSSGNVVTENYDVIQFLMQDAAPSANGGGQTLLGSGSGAAPRSAGTGTTSHHRELVGTLKLKFYLIFVNTSEQFPRATASDMSGQYRCVPASESSCTTTDDSLPLSELPSTDRSPTKQLLKRYSSQTVSLPGAALDRQAQSPRATGVTSEQFLWAGHRKRKVGVVSPKFGRSVSADTIEQPDFRIVGTGCTAEALSVPCSPPRNLLANTTAKRSNMNRFQVQAVEESLHEEEDHVDGPRASKLLWNDYEGEAAQASDENFYSDDNALSVTCPDVQDSVQRMQRNVSRRRVPRVAHKVTMEESSLQPEAVTYLTFVSPQQSSMQKIVEAEVLKTKERLKQLLAEAMQHCRRDQLWNKLLAGVVPEADRAKDTTTSGISFMEFEELLGCVNFVPFHDRDPRLKPLVTFPVHWRKDVVKCFASRFSGQFREFVGYAEGKVYVAVLNSNCLDTLLLFSFNEDKKTTNMSLVYRDLASVQAEQNPENKQFREQQVNKFFEDVINTLAYHLWTKLLFTNA